MIEDFQAVDTALADFSTNHTASLTDAQRAKLTSIVADRVPPARVAHFTEFVYANLSGFDDAAKVAASELVDFATTHAFYGLGYFDRGAKISATLKGETVTDAPAIDPNWLVA
jgi:hypothetical protein